MLALPIVIAFWIIGFAWKRTGWLRTSQIDVDTNLRQHDWDEINAYRARIAALPTWRRIAHKFF
jgi:amino acid transporter